MINTVKDRRTLCSRIVFAVFYKTPPGNQRESGALVEQLTVTSVIPEARVRSPQVSRGFFG